MEMTLTQKQEAIVEMAIRERQKDGFLLSCMTFALTDLDDLGLTIFLQKDIELKELYLTGCKVTDEGIGQLGQSRSLEELDVTGTSITTNGLKALIPNESLRRLALGSHAVKAGGFAVLGGFRGLTRLSIETRYRDPFIHYHRQPNTSVDSADLQHLGQLVNLVELALRGVPLQEDSLSWLSSMGKLRSINLSNTHASGAALRNLAAEPLLEELHLSNTKLDDDTLIHLVDRLEIKSIGLAHTQVTDRGVQYLAAHAPLRDVFAEDIEWSAQTCKALLNVPTLESAELNIEGVSDEFLITVCPERVWLHP